MEKQEKLELDVNFIKDHLIPEMVYARCFCDANSREFVELESTIVVPLNTEELNNNLCKLYRVSVVIQFSGEGRNFPLIVKLLSNEDTTDAAFDAFQNEEMFYSKMTLKYGTDFSPKCYLADLGRYGRPVIVLEDLEADGYRHVDDNMDEDHLALCVKVLARFHAKGLRLKEENFNVFREFYAKLLEVTFNEASLEYYNQRSRRILDILTKLPNSEVADKVRRKLGPNPVEAAKNLASAINEVSTLCHGHFSSDNLLFKYENEKPIDVKVIDWQTIRYCSPGIDLGSMVLKNLMCENLPVKLQKLVKLYIDSVMQDYQGIEDIRLKDDIVRNLPFACFILSVEENTSNEQLLQVLLQLERFGAFD